MNLQRSLNPKPVLSFGWHKVNNFFQWLTGKRKQLIAKVGIACTTALRRISLPTCDSSFSFQPWIFPHTRSFMKIRLAFLFLPTTVGKSRYLSYSFISRMPNKTLMVSLVAEETEMLKKSVILFLFICCLEAFSYSSRIFWMHCISPNCAWKNNRLSSTKNSWEIFGPFLQRENPRILFSWTTFFMRPVNPSEHKRKR